MISFRVVVALLPQVLIVMFVGGEFELLGGFNRTDAGFSILIALFLVTPVATLALLVVETVRYILQVRRDDATRSFSMPAVAMLLFFEALAVDLYLISQFRMH